MKKVLAEVYKNKQCRLRFTRVDLTAMQTLENSHQSLGFFFNLGSAGEVISRDIARCCAILPIQARNTVSLINFLSQLSCNIMRYHVTLHNITQLYTISRNFARYRSTLHDIARYRAITEMPFLQTLILQNKTDHLAGILIKGCIAVKCVPIKILKIMFREIVLLKLVYGFQLKNNILDIFYFM